MAYLAHTTHPQFGALWLAWVGWTLTAVALGLMEWRVWQVSDTRLISSGVAWVGIWRACFNSYTVVSDGFRNMHCRNIHLGQAFTPPEIAAGQVLMLLSLLVGLGGNAAGVYVMRNAYFGVRTSLIQQGFVTAGLLYLLAAVLSLVPLLWNLTSILTNETIHFPPEFQFPQVPDSQQVGSGISVGIVGSVLMVVSGIVFCSYRPPRRSGVRPSVRERLRQSSSARAGPNNHLTVSVSGRQNPVFELQEDF